MSILIPPLILEKLGLAKEGFQQPILAMFHMHTHFSHDSRIHPQHFVKFAKKSSLNLICITDHGTIKGAKEVAEILKNLGVGIIAPLGMEAYAHEGHIGCLGIKENITARNGVDIIREVHNQGGVTVYNHPFQGGRNPDLRVAEAVDCIEYPNNRTNTQENLKALQFALKLGKPVLPGCDAHQKKELFQGLVQLVPTSQSNGIVATPIPSNGLNYGNKTMEVFLKTLKTRKMTYLLEGIYRTFRR